MERPVGDVVWVHEGDRKGFERLVRATEADVRRFCAWQMGRGNQFLDDLVQETFLRAYRGLATFRGEAPVLSWLLSIARRVCLDHFARERRDESRLRELQHLAAVPVSSADASSATEIEHLVDQLPEVFREAFILVKIFGMTYDEAGTILGCPRGTIQSRVARARAMLAEFLSADTKLADPMSASTGGAASVPQSA